MASARSGDRRPLAATSRQLREHPGRRPRIGERRRADLDGRRRRRAAARRRPSPTATPPTPTIGSAGWRGVDVVDGAHGDRVDRPARQPTAAGAERRSAASPGRSASPSSVLMQRHRLGAGRRRRRRRRRRCGRCWRSASPSAAGRSAAVAAITSADSSASWAKIALRPSRFGHDRLTSTATTSGWSAGEQLGGRGGSRRPSAPR